MPDQQPIPDTPQKVRELELEILYLLTKPEDNPFLWSIAELERELENDFFFEDAIGRLRRAGLIHRTADNFVFASRAAVHQIELVGYGVI